MAIELLDILSGDEIPGIRADNMVIDEQMGFASVTDPSFDGTFVRVQGGILYTYKAPNNDAEWEDSDTTDIALTTTPQEVLSVTLDQGLTVDDGSYVISGQVDNGDNQNRSLDIIVKDDGVEIGTGVVNLAKDEVGKNFAFSGNITAPIDTGSVITVEFGASSNGALTLKGTNIPTKIKITLANGDPIVLGSSVSVDVVYDTSANLGTTLSRTEIENVLTYNGIAIFTKNEAFFIRDASDRLFMVTYLINRDTYNYERLSEAS